MCDRGWRCYQGGPQPFSLAVSPTSVTDLDNTTQLFSATTNDGSNPALTWSVDGVAGGHATTGTISTTGLFTAPEFPPSPNSISIASTETNDTTKSASSAVKLQNPTPQIKSVTPMTIPVGAFTLNITGAHFAQGAIVNFGSTTLVTIRISSTQLTATGTATSAQFPPILSISGNAIFCTGDTTRQFTMSPYSSPGLQGFDSSAASQARFQATQQLLTFDSGLSLVQSANSVTGQAVQYGVMLLDALKNIPPLSTLFANNYLAQQLRQVAQVIAARSALGMGRQIFFCSTGGFDTHSDQLTQHIKLMSNLSQSMATFYQATQELGVANQVTTFTLSEFSRTLQPGTNAGTDHAWGGHQVILGRRGEGQQCLRNLPDARAQRTRRCRQQWAVDSNNCTRSIRRYPGFLVWCPRCQPACHFPQPDKFPRPAIWGSWVRQNQELVPIENFGGNKAHCIHDAPCS